MMNTKGPGMFTYCYKGMYINGSVDKDTVYVTDDYNTFAGRTFKSYRAAMVNITKARNAGVPASR
jgi:hypothetical protein